MKFKIFISIVFIAIIFILWILFGGGDGENTKENLKNSPAIFKEEKGGKSVSVSTTSSASAQTQKYENIKYGFSFDYPNDFKISEFEEEEGRFILTAQNGETGRSLQIYITTYDDKGFVASKERILRDVPDMPFSNSADIVVADKAKGVAFFSRSEAFGETAEAWFADGRNFYQATAKAEDVKVLEEIIKSWEFEQ